MSTDGLFRTAGFQPAIPSSYLYGPLLALNSEGSASGRLW